MAFTDNCDIFIAALDAGGNRVINHVMRQRPSLFNYATEGFRERLDLFCEEIEPHPVVLKRGNPLFRVVPYLPILLSGGYGLEYCVQITIAEIDFSPGDVFTLPGELFPPLGDQRFALHGILCAGLGCPPDEIVEDLQPLVGRGRPRGTVELPGERGVEIPIPTRELICFCLELFAAGGADFAGPSGDQHLIGDLEGLEVVNLTPEGLENSIECYLKLAIELGLLPRVSIPTIKIVQELMGLATLTVEPTAAPPTVANNPALEDNQLKVFLDLSVAPPGPPPPPGPSAPPAILGVVRRRGERGEEVLFDSRRLEHGDIFALTMVRPGTYALSNAQTGAKGQIRIAYPTLGREPYRPPEPLAVACTDAGFRPGDIDLMPAQGIIFHIRTPSRIQIDLLEPNDGPMGARTPKIVGWRKRPEQEAQPETNDHMSLSVSDEPNTAGT